MVKKTISHPAEVASVTQDWSMLLPGQPVLVRHDDGRIFTATVEMKTRNSSAVWIISDDNRIRQVFGNREGIELQASIVLAGPTARVSDAREKNQSP